MRGDGGRCEGGIARLRDGHQVGMGRGLMGRVFGDGVGGVGRVGRIGGRRGRRRGLLERRCSRERGGLVLGWVRGRDVARLGGFGLARLGRVAWWKGGLESLVQR